MSLIKIYNSLTRDKQLQIKSFWMQKTGLSNTSFYKHFRKPTEKDVVICDEFLKNQP